VTEVVELTSVTNVNADRGADVAAIPVRVSEVVTAAIITFGI
jgi:hypothetical protein